MQKLSPLILLMILTLPIQSWGEEDTRPILHMATGEWEPYVTQSLPNHGGVAELVTAVVDEMGMQLRYEFVPWVRAEALVKKGHVFAAFPYAKNTKREQAFDFSDPLALS